MLNNARYRTNTKIQRQLKDLYQNVGDSMVSGGVDNMEKYQVYVGTGTCLPIYFSGNL